MTDERQRRMRAHNAAVDGDPIAAQPTVRELVAALGEISPFAEGAALAKQIAALAKEAPRMSDLEFATLQRWYFREKARRDAADLAAYKAQLYPDGSERYSR